MGLLDGMSAFGWDRDNNVATDATKNPLYTYQTIEMPVNTVNSKDNVELLKKNGELIGKYFKEFKELFDKASKDEEAKKLLDMDILNKLNDFAYDRDKLFTDIPMASIPSIWTKDDLDKNKTIQTTITTTDNVKPGEIYEVPSTVEQAYNHMKNSKKKLKSPRDFAEEQREKQVNLYEKKLNDGADNSIDNVDKANEQLDSTDRQLNAIREKLSKMGTLKELKDNDFDRSLSLTYSEVKKGNEWFKNHQKKYHMDFLKKIKKNPFYGGVSPSTNCYWKWFACTIGTSCDIVCEKCEKKYLKIKEELKEKEEALNRFVSTNATKTEHTVTEEKWEKDLKDEIKKLSKEKDKLYKQAYFELRGLDE